MEIAKKIFRWIYYIIIAIIVAIAGILFLSVVPNSPIKSFVVLSGSMEPEIHTGSVVVVKTQNSYSVGEVITFGENTKTKKPTTHRIMEVKDEDGERVYTTKGDANNAPDQQSISEDEILGKAIFSVPYAGYAVAATQKPIGFVLIIIVPAVIIIYDEGQKIKKEIIKKMDYRKRVKKRLAPSNSNEIAPAEQDSTGEDEETPVK